MNKETFTVNGKEAEKIIDNDHINFECIDAYYKFNGCDHDLWEFEAIVKRTLDNKYFSVRWYENYGCSWHELGLDEENYDFNEVFPTEKLTIIYE